MKDIDLSLSAYHYELPAQLIAQHPADRRDNSRLMVISGSDAPRHTKFSQVVDLIDPRDGLIVNDTKVFPARLFGRKETGGKAEIFLLEYPKMTGNPGQWETIGLVKASKRPKESTRIIFDGEFSCTVLEDMQDGKLRLRLYCKPGTDLTDHLQRLGQVPLPPYIERKDGTTEQDRSRYQTVYANNPGAVAAPTAGLHFTEKLLQEITGRGTLFGTVTLHVGYGTFAPVRNEDITDHQIHSEYLTIPQETIELVQKVRERGGRIWAVGTTSVRSLEYGAQLNGLKEPVEDWCDLYIYPGYNFKVVDNLITNFHLPDSSLMFLVSALVGRERLLECYTSAVQEEYRFLSYGDAMAIITKQ